MTIEEGFGVGDGLFNCLMLTEITEGGAVFGT